MKEEIANSIHDPQQLEKLYRSNKAAFKQSFNGIYPEVKEKPVAQAWYERLNFESEDISWGSSKELTFVIIASFIAGLVAKIPNITGIDAEYFYPRNLAFVVFPGLIAYFAWKQKASIKQFAMASVAIFVSIIYINLLPDNDDSDTLILACIHLPLFLWATLGFSFLGNKVGNHQGRLDFLRFNGDLVVMSAIVLIAGALMTGVTFGLFSLIDVNIEKIYLEYIVIWGLASTPIVVTYLIQTNPQLVNKVSPVIAKVFTPLVFLTLVVYLIAVIITGKDPYNDRDFLMLFNALLIGVMAIILFSIAETSKSSKAKITTLMLLGLSIATVLVNGIALSAIVFRITEWGITPNRLAVLGGNILILTNLLIVSFRLFKSVKDKKAILQVENSIASFLPIYTLWTIIVTFVFPMLFSFQ